MKSVGMVYSEPTAEVLMGWIRHSMLVEGGLRWNHCWPSARKTSAVRLCIDTHWRLSGVNPLDPSHSFADPPCKGHPW